MSAFSSGSSRYENRVLFARALVRGGGGSLVFGDLAKSLEVAVAEVDGLGPDLDRDLVDLVEGSASFLALSELPRRTRSDFGVIAEVEGPGVTSGDASEDLLGETDRKGRRTFSTPWPVQTFR